MKKIFCKAFFWAVFFLAPMVLGTTVQEVVVEQHGAGRVNTAHIKAHVQMTQGEPFSAMAASQDIKRLMDTGLFSDVNVRIEEIHDGNLRVIYTVKPRLRLAAPPDIEGVKRFRKARARKWLELDEGDLIDDQLAGVALRRLIREYRQRQFFHTSGSWTLTPVDEKRGLVSLTFHVDEGRPSYVNRVEVSGNQTLSRRDLRKALHRPSPLNPWRWFRRKKLEPHVIRDIEKDVQRLYMNEGFMDVRVEVDKTPHATKGANVAVVTIEEGERYAFGEVTIEGVTEFPLAELSAGLGLQRGDTASLEAIERAAQRLESFYGDRGYLNAWARPALVPDVERRVVDVRFLVYEGEKVSIRNVFIRGNSRTKDRVIRRELLVYPGETYNQSRVRRSETRLRNLGFFDHVRVIPETTLQEDERDLIFDVQEKRTGQFMIGAGFSSIDNLIGFMELSQGNFDLFGWPYFTGGGQKLRLRAQFGSKRKDYELSFTEPWFLNRRLSLGFDVYRRERSYSEYDLKRTGAAIRLGYPLPYASRINLQYEIERTEVTDISDRNTYFLLDTYDFETGEGTPYTFESEENRVKSALTLNVIQDTRNNPFIPTRGSRHSLFYTVAGGPLGFDMDYYNVGFQTTTFFPLWFGHVLNLRLRTEFVEPFGDTDEVPLSERLFLGGGRTLRGFRFRDVGPKVIRPLEGTDHYFSRPYGGQSLFMVNVEYTVPIVQGIRLGMFYDTGNVWSDRYKVDLKDLASSAGVGLRLDIPGFPIRIDRAWVIEPDDDFSDDDKWVIWIGYDY